jgi:3' exoribonuclease, RNase T-like
VRIFYDTEFIEDGSTIDLISIGLVAEDGSEYYAVSNEFSLKKLAANDWLMANVWPSLPQVRGDERMMVLSGMREGASTYQQVRRLFDPYHAVVLPRAQIARDVWDFIRGVNDPQLWAWYGSYDHVAYAQLFGRMIDLPAGLPMFTCDLKQEAQRLGNPRVPEQAAGQHNALADARHNQVIAQFLDTL